MKNKSIPRRKVPVLAISLFGMVAAFAGPGRAAEQPAAEKLYWFVPDGMRADPDVFDIYAWAKQGKLPNIKKMMDEGSYGYCIPNFPSHTPTNFATMMTGASPKTHGVADGPMHTEGFPLDRPSVGGFSSTAKKVPPVWVTLEERGKKVALLSVPGSTPPELNQGITVRGRWGGWGADFHPLIFQAKENLAFRKKQGAASRLFYFGPHLTNYVEPVPAEGWTSAPRSFSPALEAATDGWGQKVHLYLYASTRGAAGYDRILFSTDKKTPLADLAQGQWSEWANVVLKWKDIDVPLKVKINVIKLSPEGFFRVRFLYDTLNEHIVKPGEVADELRDGAGPMVDFVDNYPAQLIYFDPEDKDTFLQEQDLSFDWHRRAGRFILGNYKPDIFIQDIYSPNQMLTSRWWMGALDPVSARYNDVSEAERAKLWEEVHRMYKQLDDLVGNMLKAADGKTLVVLSSDHGAVPLDKSVRLNNLFAREGLLKFSLDPATGEPLIDWEHTQAVFLKMDGIYLRPDGLAGDWKRASGKDYEKLRARVARLLRDLKDGNNKVLTDVVPWEKARRYLNLPPDRVGDLVVANAPGYGFSEDVTDDMEIFDVPLIAGYKQAIAADKVKGMWTPFMVWGPGVKKNYRIPEPIRLIDQYPTLMTLLGQPVPGFVEGRMLKEIIDR